MVQYKVQLSVKIAQWIYDESEIETANNKTARIEELLVKGILHEKREESFLKRRQSSEAVHNSPEVWRQTPSIHEEHPVMTEPCPVSIA